MTVEALARLTGDQEPAVPIGLASLARSAFVGEDLAPLGCRLTERVMADPRDAAALMDLSTIMQLLGHHDAGLAWQVQALAVQRIYRRPPARVSPDGIRILAFMAPGDFMANTPLEFLLEDSDVALDMYYFVPGAPLAQPIPDHDVAFVAAGQADENRAVLHGLEDIVRSWPCPVLNRPERIAALFPDGAHALLTSEPGLATAITDYRGSDGQFRKYRIAVIDGRPYACQVAISDRPVVHYHETGMRESAEKRAEEARFITEFESDFASRHKGALRALWERVGLDYFCVDCAEAADGRLLPLEIDVAMIIHAMDSPELFPYKAPQMRKIREAFRAMLRLKAGRFTER